MRRKWIALALAAVCAAVLRLFLHMGAPGPAGMYEKSLTQAQADTGAGNIVAGIYLDYRVFDTLLEALLLMVAVIGVRQFSRLEDNENLLTERTVRAGENPYSPVLRSILRVLYPFLLLFGFYILLTGADAPGGGFQGGAILAAVVMSRYLSDGGQRPDFHKPELAEKIILLLIVLMVTVFMFLDAGRPALLRRFYLNAMNLLIGGKVGFGLMVIFLQFVHRERQDTP